MWETFGFIIFAISIVAFILAFRAFLKVKKQAKEYDKRNKK